MKPLKMNVKSGMIKLTQTAGGRFLASSNLFVQLLIAFQSSHLGVGVGYYLAGDTEKGIQKIINTLLWLMMDFWLWSKGWFGQEVEEGETK